MSWSTEMVERLISLWKNGLTASEIGEKVYKSRNAVMGKLNRLGMVGDGSHEPGVGGFHRKPKKFKIAPPSVVPPRRRRAKGVGRSFASLGAVPPPPLLPLKKSSNGWKGVTGAIDGLQMGECRWPLPDGLIKANAFCGAPSEPGMAYCLYHLKQACKDPNAPKEWYERDGKRDHD